MDGIRPEGETEIPCLRGEPAEINLPEISLMEEGEIHLHEAISDPIREAPPR